MQIEQAEAESKDDAQYFPKLHAPYKRVGQSGSKYVTNHTNPGYDWVFEDAEDVLAVEKLDGENVSVTFNDDFEPVAIHRRGGARGDPAENGYEMVEVPMWNEDESHYAEGVVNAFGQGWIEYLDSPGQHFGELVGPRMQGNRYDLDKHYWVPFDYARERLVYKSYGDHPTDYGSIRDWLVEVELPPLFYRKMNGGISFEQAKAESEVEGIVFTHPDPDAVDTLPMAKLTIEMFEEYHKTK